jgi:hypothetical protein
VCVPIIILIGALSNEVHGCCLIQGAHHNEYTMMMHAVFVSCLCFAYPDLVG